MGHWSSNQGMTFDQMPPHVIHWSDEQYINVITYYDMNILTRKMHLKRIPKIQNITIISEFWASIKFKMKYVFGIMK